MDEVVIRKKDLDRLARTLLKEIFEFIQDNYLCLELKKNLLASSLFNLEYSLSNSVI